MPRSKVDPKRCAECDRPAVRLRPEGWMCMPHWRASAGINALSFDSHGAQPRQRPVYTEPRKTGRPISLNEDRALVLRWCSEAPQRVLTLARVTLCIPWRDAYEVARTLIRAELMETAHRQGDVSYFTATDKGRAALAAYDATETSVVVAQRDVSEGANT